MVDSTVGLGRSTASLSFASVASDSTADAESHGGSGGVDSSGGHRTQHHSGAHGGRSAVDATASTPQPLTIDITDTGLTSEPNGHRRSAAAAVGSDSSTCMTSACAVESMWFWASGTGSVAYDSDICSKLEVAWQALQRNELGAHDSARRVDIGAGRHVDLVRGRQVVTAEPHRTRRVFRQNGA